MDQAIHQFTEGHITAETLGRIEAELAAKIADAQKDDSDRQKPPSDKIGGTEDKNGKGDENKSRADNQHHRRANWHRPNRGRCYTCGARPCSRRMHERRDDAA